MSTVAEELVTPDNKAKVELMVKQCRALVLDVTASSEAAETADAGTQLLSIAQQAVAEHLLSLLQVC